MNSSEIITDFQQTGACKIDIGVVVKKWSHLYSLVQYKDKYTLVKYKRKDSPIRVLKVEISEQQAKELIDTLGLLQLKNTCFRYASSWKQFDKVEICLSKYGWNIGDTYYWNYWLWEITEKRDKPERYLNKVYQLGTDKGENLAYYTMQKKAKPTI